jgi:hypothetical protein
MATVTPGSTLSNSLHALLNETGVALARERTLLKLRLDSQRALNRAARDRRRRRRARRGGHLEGEPTGGVQTVVEGIKRLLVLGVVTNPRTPAVRGWIRDTYMAEPAAQSSEVLLRFIVGRRGLTSNDNKLMLAEQLKHSDVEFIDASDFGERGGIFSCIDKARGCSRPT